MKKRTLLTAFALVSLANDAAAQIVSAPPVPNAVLTLPSVRSKAPQSAPRIEEQLNLPGANFPAVQIHAVRLVGANSLSKSELARDFAGVIGKTANAGELRATLDAVERSYANAGFALGRAYIPEQQMTDGVLVVRVLEGYIGAVAIETDTPRIKESIAPYAERLLAGRPLRSEELARCLRLIAEIPGVTVSAKLTDMNLTTGAVGLVLTIVYKPFVTSLAVDTRSNVRGLPVQPYLTVKANNLIGVDDQFALTGLLSPVPNAEYFLQASGSAAIGDDGWRVASIASLAKARANILPPSIDLSSTQLRSEINASYPLTRTAGQQTTLAAGSYLSQLHYDLNHATIARDRTMAVYSEISDVREISNALSASFTGRGTFGWALPYVPPIAGSRANAARDFAKLDIGGALGYAVTGNVSVLLRADGQAATGSLPAAEEVSYGADRFGRGYDSGMISGDRGIAVSLQPQYSFAVAPDWNAGTYLFGDFARAFNTRGDLQGDATLMSAGVGASLSHGNYSASLGIAEPLRTVPGYNLRRSPRLFGTFQVKV